MKEESRIRPNVQLPNADKKCSSVALSEAAELFPKDDQEPKQNDSPEATPYTDTREVALKEERVVSFDDQNRVKKENFSKLLAPQDENQNRIKPNTDCLVDEVVEAKVDPIVTVSDHEEPISFNANRKKKEDALRKHNRY